jgi:hypothetical protein
VFNYFDIFFSSSVFEEYLEEHADYRNPKKCYQQFISLRGFVCAKRVKKETLVQEL